MNKTITNNKTMITVAAVFVAGVVSGIGVYYIYNKTATFNRFSDMYVMALNKTPACIPEGMHHTKGQATDVDFSVYHVQYNEAMIPQLETFLGTLTDKTYRSLVQDEIAREKKETTIARRVYASVAGKEYDGTATSPFFRDNPISRDTLTATSTSELDERSRMSLLRGILERQQREIYSFEFVSENKTLRENAFEFMKFKERYVYTLNQRNK